MVLDGDNKTLCSKASHKDGEYLGPGYPVPRRRCRDTEGRKFDYYRRWIAHASPHVLRSLAFSLAISCIRRRTWALNSAIVLSLSSTDLHSIGKQGTTAGKKIYPSLGEKASGVQLPGFILTTLKLLVRWIGGVHPRIEGLPQRLVASNVFCLGPNHASPPFAAAEHLRNVLVVQSGIVHDDDRHPLWAWASPHRPHGGDRRHDLILVKSHLLCRPLRGFLVHDAPTPQLWAVSESMTQRRCRSGAVEKEVQKVELHCRSGLSPAPIPWGCRCLPGVERTPPRSRPWCHL